MTNGKRRAWVSGGMDRFGVLRWVAGFALLMGGAPGLAAAVLFNEIHYHAASHDPREDFIELHNTGASPVALQGWRIAGGVEFAFGNSVVIPAGGYLVVAADAVRLAEVHPGLDRSRIVGPFAGQLSNAGEVLELRDGAGGVRSRVRFGQDGEWSARIRSAPDFGHRGWEWSAGHDGGGRSLELIQPALEIDAGQNWAASIAEHGSPGAVNGVASTDVAPLILEVQQFPVVPTSRDVVYIRARIQDEKPAVASVRLHHGLVADGVFDAVPMFDDGVHGDGAAGDGVYGTVLPARPTGSLVEFYLSATDAGGKVRTWPAPAVDDGVSRQVLNAFYLVDDVPVAGRLPTYRLLMRPEDRAELLRINRNQGAPPEPTNDQTRSHARFNATFIGSEGGESAVRYGVLVRNRGNGSRFRSPQSFRVDFPATDRWHGARGINLNTQYPDSQWIGSVLARRSGIAAALSTPVHLRLNGTNHAAADAPSYGFLVANEVLDSDFAERQFPLDPNGNLYRAQRLDGVAHAALDDRGSHPDAYRTNYFKRTNVALDDWSDLTEMCRIASLADDAEWRRELPRLADLGQWARYFAYNTMVDNRETSPVNGQGDDYFLYRGVRDSRFQLLPYDQDTILNVGDSPSRVDAGLFQMVGGSVTNFARFVTDREFVPAYFRELRRLAREVLSPEALGPLVQQVLTGASTERRMKTMTDFGTQRAAFVLAAIPDRLAIGPNLVTNGTPVTAQATFELHGQADPERTARIRVDGIDVEWAPWRMRWTNAVALRPGLNRILVQALDRQGTEIERVHLDVRRSTVQPATPVAGALAGQTRWTAAASPYLMTGEVRVPAGAVLEIEPGVTVYAAPNSGLRVEGRIVAEGTPERRIRFAANPGTATPANSWQGLLFSSASGTNRLVHVDFEHAGSARHTISVTASTLVVDDCTFAGTTTTLIETSNSSLHVRGCVFPSLSGAELIHGGDIPAGGFVIIEGNRFGTTTGLNDIIDFSRARRPGPVLQIRDNVFTGASDDVLDLDGCDAHIEGNVFMHVTNGDPGAADTSSAISFGEDGGYGPHVVVARNLFLDVDHVALCKEGGFVTLEQNTAIGVGIAAVNFSEPLRGVKPGAGARLSGNMFVECPSVFENRTPTNGTVRVEAAFNAWAGADAGSAGPLNRDWRRYPSPAIAPRLLEGADAATLIAATTPVPGSPAWGTGPEGGHLGAAVPRGAVLEGVPPVRTWRDSVEIRVGGAGLVAYRARLDAGDWSAGVSSTNHWVLRGLAPGRHVIEVVGQDSAGLWQPVTSATHAEWTVDPLAGGLVLNRILPSNASLRLSDGRTPDLVELMNTGSGTVDLGGVSISDDPGNPRRFAFPPGRTLGSGQRLLLAADVVGAPDVPPLGFHLSAEGGRIDLLAGDGMRLDSVRYGAMGPDLMWGRVPDGTGDWTLIEPRLDGPATRRPYVDASPVRINEWLASPRGSGADDLLELFNTADFPADLGGSALTDNRIGEPAKSVLPSPSFVGPNSAQVWRADGNELPGHLAFRLSAEQGAVSLLSPEARVIDEVFYGRQTMGVSEGRSPNGQSSFRTFVEPTPGGPNPGGLVQEQVLSERIHLVDWTQVWAYRDDGLELDPAWKDPGFPDSGWPKGPGLLYRETATLPAPKSTPLKLGALTFYFRTRFHVDPARDLTGGAVELNHILDDGAVVWINGQEWTRISMPAGPISYTTLATRTVGDASLQGPVVLPISALVPGENTLAVEVHESDAGSSDVVFGAALDFVRQQTNRVMVGNPVVLNEVVARGGGAAALPQGPVDWVELYNASTNAVDVSDGSLSDDPAEPRKHVLPAGSVIAARGRLVLPASVVAGAGDSLGFGLTAEGGAVYWFDSLARGGALGDVVRYGHQIPDHSIGRVPDGDGPWTLSQPTPGLINVAAPTGPATDLRINEWMAAPLTGEDWFELVQLGPLPVDLSGCSVSDEVFQPRLGEFPPLTFVGAGTNGFLRLNADGTGSRPDSVAFKLSRDGERLGLYGRDPGGAAVDVIAFGPQLSGVSEGRFPDGAAVIQPFPGSPTPGASNRRAPEVTDADGDGLPDAWETLHGLKTNDAGGDQGAAGDPDGDGASNLSEWRVGTDPRDPTSVLRLAWRMSGEVMRLEFVRPAGRVVELQRSSGGDWSPQRVWETLQTWSAGSAADALVVPVSVGDSNVGGTYYRLVVRGTP